MRSLTRFRNSAKYLVLACLLFVTRFLAGELRRTFRVEDSSISLFISLFTESRRHENVRRMQNLLGGMTFEIVVAVNGTDAKQVAAYLDAPSNTLPPLCDNPERSKSDAEYLAVLGCTLSHLKAIEFAHTRQVDWALILEDDVVEDLRPFWQHRLSEFVLLLPPGWSVVQLSLIGSSEMWTELIAAWERNPLIVLPSTTFWSTGAYIISRNAIELVIHRYVTSSAHFDLNKLPCANADVHFLKDAVPRGSFYVATPPLFTTAEDDPSFIHVNNSHYDVHMLSRKVALDWSSRSARTRSSPSEFSIAF